MQKIKGGMRESKLFDTTICPVVRLATKAHLHPRCWSTHKEYCFSATKSFPWTQSRSPWVRVPLSSFTKKGGGLHVPRTKMSSPLHTKPKGQWRCRRTTKTPRGGTPSTRCGSHRRIIRSHRQFSALENMLYAECYYSKSDAHSQGSDNPSALAG